MSFDQQLEIVKNREGFIAALDQSGGSTPKALHLLWHWRIGIFRRGSNVRPYS